MDAANHHAHPIITKLRSTLTLSDDEKAAILRLPMHVMGLKADQDIVREGDRPTRSCALLEGFACTYKITDAGKRQIIAFHIPGDLPDLQSLHLRTLDNSVGTLTACRVGFIQHQDLRALCHAHPRIADALWRETLIDGAIYREWVLNIGRRDAYAGIAHLLCEWMTRLRAVGLTQDLTCELPMTQIELGDAVSLSTVHVNRTLKELRGAGLVTLRRGSLTVSNWDRLVEAGGFDPTYLHQEGV